MELLYEDKYIKINLDKAHSCLEYSWLQFTPAEEYKKLLDKVYDYTIQYGITKLSTDVKDMRVIPQDAQEWTNTDWFPRMMQQGVKHYAISRVKPGGASMSIKAMEQAVKEQMAMAGVTTEYFDDIESARKWIESL